MLEPVNNFGALTATSSIAAINNFVLRFLVTVRLTIIDREKISVVLVAKYSQLNTIMWFSCALVACFGNEVVARL